MDRQTSLGLRLGDGGVRVVSPERPESREDSYLDDESLRWYNHLGNSLAVFLNLGVYLNFDPAIPLLCIYPREMSAHIHLKACIEVCLAALFIRAYNYIIQMSISKRLDKQVAVGRSKLLK